MKIMNIFRNPQRFEKSLRRCVGVVGTYVVVPGNPVLPVPLPAGGGGVISVYTMILGGEISGCHGHTFHKRIRVESANITRLD